MSTDLAYARGAGELPAPPARAGGMLRVVSDRDQLLRQLHDEPQRSRNRHFDELSRPEFTAARKSLRRLAGIARELKVVTEGARQARLEEHGKAFLLTIRFPSVRAQRVALISREELAILMDDVALRPLLDGISSERAA